jgi:hypothetical protein
MRREYRKPTRAEWERITSRRPVVRRIPKPRGETSRQRLLLEEMERQADPFGVGLGKTTTGRHFPASRNRTRRRRQSEPERGQWERENSWA